MERANATGRRNRPQLSMRHDNDDDVDTDRHVRRGCVWPTVSARCLTMCVFMQMTSQSGTIKSAAGKCCMTTLSSCVSPCCYNMSNSTNILEAKQRMAQSPGKYKELNTFAIYQWVKKSGIMIQNSQRNLDRHQNHRISFFLITLSPTKFYGNRLTIFRAIYLTKIESQNITSCSRRYKNLSEICFLQPRLCVFQYKVCRRNREAFLRGLQ